MKQISVFLGSCTQTIDALAEGASGKLKPPLGTQPPSSVRSGARSISGCTWKSPWDPRRLVQPPIIALGLKTNYIRLRGWCMIVPYCNEQHSFLPIRCYEFHKTRSSTAIQTLSFKHVLRETVTVISRQCAME